MTRKHLTLDFETRSPLDVRRVGAYVYTQDPRTTILCLAADYDGEQAVIFNPRFDKLPWWLQDALEDPDVRIHAHNAGFERLVIRNIATPRLDWPRIVGKRFRCSAARARRMALPGALDKAGAALGLDIQKDRDGARIMRRMTRPIKVTPDGYVYDNDPKKMEQLGDYCLVDIHSEIELDEVTYPLPEREERYYQLTEQINDRGVKVDVALVKRLIWRANEATEELNTRLREITRNQVSSLTEVAKLKKWVEDETGQILNTLRKEDMEGLLDEASALGLPDYVKDALKIRQEGAKSSVAKLVAILDRVSSDGRIHGAFVFHGASTGRYTSMGVQLQNLVRDTHKDFEEAVRRLEEFTLTEISKTIRQCFIPERGCVFIDADYNAIEARGVGWLAGAKKLLDIYRRGGDPYCEMGTAIYGFNVTKEHEAERFVGKQTILGCGYGMGAAKFEAQCEKFGQPVSSRMAKNAVDTYREEFPEIPELWKDMEWAAIKAVKTPGKVISCAGGKIKYLSKDGYLRMMLPSGRPLFYKSPKILRENKFDREQDVLSFMAQNSVTKQWMRETTWGGKLTENAVQAICRDLLFDAMERIELRDIPIVLSVHDQLVCEVHEADAKWAARVVQEEMEYVPDWAKGFPVKAEPKIALRFGK